MKKVKFPEIKVKVTRTKGEEYQIKGSQDAVDVFRQIFNADTIIWTEEMILLCLNRANKVIGYYKISSGGFAGTVCDPKVVLTIALQSAASSIIMAHNHPSGNLNPSESDIRIAKKIRSACELLDINCFDNLIITDEGYTSFEEKGLF